jgi:hypothetical protein
LIRYITKHAFSDRELISTNLLVINDDYSEASDNRIGVDIDHWFKMRPSDQDAAKVDNKTL